jgi:thioredoxin 1
VSGARDVTDATFADEVLAAGVPVVVDFWAPWCGPCRAVEPVLARLEAEHDGRLRLARVDVDANPDVAARYGVLALPTAILFSGGEPREMVVGPRSQSHYERAFAPWLGAQATAT